STLTYKVENLTSGKQYSFYVVAKDKAGNKTNYLTKTVETLDTIVPTVSSKEISATSITANSITLSWQAATDNKTAQSEIEYDVYQGSTCIKSGLKSASSTLTYKVENLTSGKQYSFYVVAKDKAGNKTNYLTKTVETLDTIAPTVSSKEISATNISANTITLLWNAATDNKTPSSKIWYEVYRGSSLIKSGENITSYVVTGLSPDTQYSFYVVAKDTAGNKTTYPTRSFRTRVNKITLEIEQKATVVPRTNSVELELTYTFVKVDSNGKVIGVEAAAKPWDYKWSNNKGTSDVILLDKNCYFQDNRVFVRLKSRRGATAGLNKWKECSCGYLNVTGSHLKIRIEGSYFSYSLRLGGDPKDGYARFM
ncbi:MAG: fibronectin type III domain-containing protein, partial [Paludibacteraceae bacterium]|nr:fibronectin type III domain-containing protein [Paludibacteraceae bacterium]